MQLAATRDTPVLRRLATLVAGLVIVAVGVACTIRAEVGVAPYDVLSTGIADRAGIAIGAAAMVLPLAFTLLGVALGGRVGLGTFLAVLLVGPILQVVLDALPDVDAMAVRVPLFAFGLVVTAIGITAVVIAEIGPGPAEVLMLAVHDRGQELARARTGIEVSSAAIGWALGGQLGVGTAVFAVVIGPLLRVLLRRSGYRAEDCEEAALLAEPGV